MSVYRKSPKAVIDTCVLLAGISAFREPFVSGRNPSGDLLRLWVDREAFVWLVTPEILEEYREVAQRHNVRRAVIGRLVNLLGEEAEEIPTETGPCISPDPGDDPFCVCAEDGRADFVVTLNTRDFPQEKLKAEVVSPADFLEVLQRGKR